MAAAAAALAAGAMTANGEIDYKKVIFRFFFSQSDPVQFSSRLPFLLL